MALSSWLVCKDASGVRAISISSTDAGGFKEAEDEAVAESSEKQVETTTRNGDADSQGLLVLFTGRFLFQGVMVANRRLRDSFFLIAIGVETPSNRIC